MKINRIRTIIVAVACFAATAQAYFDPTIGRWANRDPIGEPFPRVTIFDGAGQMIFGTENFSTGNYLLQKNLTIYDAYKFSVKNHSFTVGADLLSSNANNFFIRDLY